MRLWHQDLLKYLPREQLLGQHREICALRGNSWGKKHATVNYVFKHSPVKLYAFHCLVMQEMKARGYHVDPVWEEITYRGKNCEPYGTDMTKSFEVSLLEQSIYLEHDNEYLEECLANLKRKGVVLRFKR